MTRRKTFFIVNETVPHLSWIVETEEGAAVFCVRCPTEHWHYFVVLGFSVHMRYETGENETGNCVCDYLKGNGRCYGRVTHSQLFNETVWNKYKACLKDEIIFSELEETLEHEITKIRTPNYEI